MKEAARQLDIPYTTYVNYEKGTREPNSEMLKTLADFFEVTIDYLVCRDNVNTQCDTLSTPDEDLKFALWGGDCDEITNEMLNDVKKYAEFVRSKKNKND